MNIVFDTNAILLYLKNEGWSNYIDENFMPFEEENNVLISVVSIGEIKSLAKRNKWGRNRLQKTEFFLESLVIVDIRYADLIEAYAEIDVFSQGKLDGKPLHVTARNMGKNDLWIAATCFVTDSILLTTDKDFEHLHGVYFDVALVEQQ